MDGPWHPPAELMCRTRRGKNVVFGPARVYTVAVPGPKWKAWFRPSDEPPRKTGISSNGAPPGVANNALVDRVADLVATVAKTAEERRQLLVADGFPRGVLFQVSLRDVGSAVSTMHQYVVPRLIFRRLGFRYMLISFP